MGTMYRDTPQKLSLNVLVVYDVFAARISETAGFAGLQKCGEVRRGSERSDRPSRTKPSRSSGVHIQSCYMPVAFI